MSEALAVRAPCSTGGRHWFTVYGWVGQRSPFCRRCKASNPRPLTPEEQRSYDDLMAHIKKGWA